MTLLSKWLMYQVSENIPLICFQSNTRGSSRRNSKGWGRNYPETRAEKVLETVCPSPHALWINNQV